MKWWQRKKKRKGFTADQPKHGETIIHCGHMEVKTHHFYRIQVGGKFQRPDGTFGQATWQLACDNCQTLARGDVRKLPVRGDGIWQGDDPIIKET